MERTESMRIFLRVAELTSFTKASDSLGIPKATVSLAVQQLENLTGTRLLHRTTRKVSLTQDGLAWYERSRDLLADLEEMESMFKSGAELVGRLRVDMPSGLAKSVLMANLPEFLARHPRVQFELSSTDRKVDVIQEGFDCVVRVGFAADPGVMVRPLGRMSLINCASPAYLERYGTPLELADLAHHQLIHYSPVLGSKPGGFEYWDGSEYRSLQMTGSVTVNNSDAYRAACLSGLGIIQVPRLGVNELLASGDLREILPHLLAEPMPISLLYPQRRNLSRLVKAFLEWAAQLLQSQLDEG